MRTKPLDRTSIPGTFDPITRGHLDIISAGDQGGRPALVIAVARNAGKGPLFSVDERVEMVRARRWPRLDTNGAEIEVHDFDNLLVDFAEEIGARIIIRGLRAVSDFEYEFQMASMNTRLAQPQ